MMIRALNRSALLAVSLSLVIPALVGCKPNEDAVVATPVPLEKKKQDIQNNSKMPPQAKAAALAALQRSPSQGSLPGPAPQGK